MCLILSRTRSEDNFRYRIGVINDFRDSFSFIDYKVYGELKIFDACRVAGVDRKEDGSISVFLNFKKVGEFKSKSEAVSKLRELLGNAPCSFFDENKDVLLKDLC
jgi:hypothetical protein